MTAWIASAVVSLCLGLALKVLDAKQRGGRPVNPKRLTGLQVASALLLTYPFALAYVYLEQRL